VFGRTNLGIVINPIRLALGVATVGALVLLAGAAAAQDNEPNIVVIWGDDIGESNISAYNFGLMGYQMS